MAHAVSRRGTARGTGCRGSLLRGRGVHSLVGRAQASNTSIEPPSQGPDRHRKARAQRVTEQQSLSSPTWWLVSEPLVDLFSRQLPGLLRKDPVLGLHGTHGP